LEVRYFGSALSHSFARRPELRSEMRIGNPSEIE